MTFAISASERKPTLMPGLLLTGTIVAVAFGLRQVSGLMIFSPLVLAILLGVLFRNTMGLPMGTEAGMRFALRRLLRLGVVTLGLQLTLTQVASIGVSGLVTIGLGLAGTYVFTIWAGRALGVAPDLSRFIAIGTSVCGASAVLAAHAAVGGKDEDVAYAIAGVTLFGTIAMLVLPVLGSGMAAHDYGLWTGASIHEVAQVVAAGTQHGPGAVAFATIAKLTRVALLGPVILIVARGRGQQERTPFPAFVLGFLAMVALASVGVVPEAVIRGSAPLTQMLLAMGLAAMGLQTDITRLLLKGFRPLALGALASIFIAALTLALVFMIARF